MNRWLDDREVTSLCRTVFIVGMLAGLLGGFIIGAWVTGGTW